MHKFGKKTLLIDADMRKGRQYSIFGLLPKPGLSNYLLDFSEIKEEAKILDYIQKTEVENLSIMTAGSIPPNPSELLVSETMMETIEKLKDIYDIIILDGPPVELVTDSIILTRIVDSTAIVTACNETKKDNLHKVIDSIKNVDGKIAGVVVNKMLIPAKEYKNSYYYGNDKRK
ncbi:MAG: CpsD/CapB family tyrosine-protein kinase [Clostridia bacterium]|nr:CpsD/CapB family tyrosine-protein kinase [Clostridia bacterium]